jgi:hypothetical protein
MATKGYIHIINQQFDDFGVFTCNDGSNRLVVGLAS